MLEEYTGSIPALLLQFEAGTLRAGFGEDMGKFRSPYNVCVSTTHALKVNYHSNKFNCNVSTVRS